MKTPVIIPELNLKNIIAESREVAQALNEFADDLERIEKKYAEPEEVEKRSCSYSDSCEHCKYNDGDCCRLIYEEKMESEESDADSN